MTTDSPNQAVLFQSETHQINIRQTRLFRKRPSSNVDGEIREIKNILEGRIPTLALSEIEKKDLLGFEDSLGEELEQTIAIKARSESFSLDYFFTEPGKTDFSKLFPGQEMPFDTNSLKRFFYSKSQELSQLDEKFLEEISAKAKKHSEDQLEVQMLSAIDEEGRLQLTSITYRDSVNLNFDTQLSLNKLKKLRSIKRSLHRQIREAIPPFSALTEAKQEILQMYLIKVNEYLANCYSSLLRLQGKSELIGLQNLDEAEREILILLVGKKNRARTQSILDKFVFGTANKFNQKGDYEQISEEVEAKIATVLEEKKDFAQVQRSRILEQGYDPEKVLAETVQPEQRKTWGDQILSQYGILSEEDSTTYLKSRTEPASDGKWQYVLRPDRKTLGVNPRQKVVLDSDFAKRDIIKGLIVACGHEIEGHVIQQENKALIPLRLFKIIGGDRGHLMAEGGALYNEDQLIQHIFGYKRPIATFYVKAMQRKQQGGDFLDCFQVAYDIEISGLRAKYDLNKPEEKEKFINEAKKTVRMLFPRIKRIFSGVALSDRSGYLPNTKDTVYLEQEILMEKLAQSGLKKLAFLGRMNLRNIATLLKLGLLHFEEILEPQYHTLKIWESIKDQYKSTGVENTEIPPITPPHPSHPSIAHTQQ